MVYVCLYCSIFHVALQSQLPGIRVCTLSAPILLMNHPKVLTVTCYVIIQELVERFLVYWAID